MSEQQKRPPCDACGAESCDGPISGRHVNGAGYYLCRGCWCRGFEETEKIIAARRTKQEPEFYGTMPDQADLPSVLPPETYPAGCDGSHPLTRLERLDDGQPRYVCDEGIGCCWCPPDRLDWSRIPRQPAATRGKLDDMAETAKPDPYARIRENEHAATVNTLAHDLERRRTGKIAALRLDLDRPSGKVKYQGHPATWPSHEGEDP